MAQTPMLRAEVNVGASRASENAFPPTIYISRLLHTYGFARAHMAMS
jgi:hypothetical protein